MGRLSCTFELKQTFECSVCKQLLDEEDRITTTQIVVLFGADPICSRCCCCGQSVEDWKDRAYQARWQRWAHKLVRERMRELKRLMAERRGVVKA
jgi:hypothetical protein